MDKERFFKENQTGFTLTELMIVVGIIGLLALIAIPNYLTSYSRSTVTICRSNQKIIYASAILYQMKEAESLEAISGNGARLQALIDNGYLRGQKWCDCPSGRDGDYDDYVMIFTDGFVTDIECDEKPTEHIWP